MPWQSGLNKTTPMRDEQRIREKVKQYHLLTCYSLIHSCGVGISVSANSKFLCICFYSWTSAFYGLFVYNGR